MEEKIFFKKLGESITKIRKSKKQTLVDLASACNFEKSNLIRIEKGRTYPTTKTLLKLANALEVEVKDFFDF
jgi:transcriptional regulator with XRE-family HTH domain